MVVRTGLIVTKDDTAEWRLRTARAATRRLWIMRVLNKLDPPRRKIPISTLRWTQAGVLVAIFFGLFNPLSTPNDDRSSLHLGTAATDRGTVSSSSAKEIAYSIGLTGEIPTLAKPFILGLSALGGPDVLQ
jgi:hypothetical protein